MYALTTDAFTLLLSHKQRPGSITAGWRDNPELRQNSAMTLITDVC
jgi:hypothetical protein